MTKLIAIGKKLRNSTKISKLVLIVRIPFRGVYHSYGVFDLKCFYA